MSSPRIWAAAGMRSLASAVGVALLASPAFGGTLTVLHSFTGGADGATPYKGPTISAGTLYGETFYGANACADSYEYANVGCGTFYKFTSAGVLSPLVTFKGATNGADGFGNVTVSGKTLYGTAYLGGTNDAGVLFSLATTGKSFTSLHVFDGTDGEQPDTYPRLGTDGTLYSVASYGGPDYNGKAGSGFGALFAIQTDGTYVSEHPFSGGTDGGVPGRIFLDSSNTIYGTTAIGGSCTGTGVPASGCGVLYSFVPSTATFTVLHTFDGVNDGFSPTIGAIDSKGDLYGAAYEGGAHGYGTLFELKNNGAAGYAFLRLYAFTGGADGAYPFAPARSSSGALIGDTLYGPITANSDGAGILYSFAAKAVTPLYTFVNDANGGYPQGTPVLDTSGNIYGTTAYGGIQPCYVGNVSTSTEISSFGCGVLFKYAP